LEDASKKMVTQRLCENVHSNRIIDLLRGVRPSRSASRWQEQI